MQKELEVTSNATAPTPLRTEYQYTKNSHENKPLTVKLLHKMHLDATGFLLAAAQFAQLDNLYSVNTQYSPYQCWQCTQSHPLKACPFATRHLHCRLYGNHNTTNRTNRIFFIMHQHVDCKCQLNIELLRVASGGEHDAEKFWLPTPVNFMVTERKKQRYKNVISLNSQGSGIRSS